MLEGLLNYITEQAKVRSLGQTIAAIALVLTSCSTTQALPILGFDFFVPADAADPWNSKIKNWQGRHATDETVHGVKNADSSLGRDYDLFSREIKRRVAKEAVAWVQARSRSHYRPDGASDHWATLGEVIRSGADDCDGLDLMTFVLLRKMGFAKDEIYRAIIVEDGTGQHHMVTLWFEGGERTDPFVLDPTGVVTNEMVRLSQVPDWEPIELFDEQAHFEVRNPKTPGLMVSDEGVAK